MIVYSDALRVLTLTFWKLSEIAKISKICMKKEKKIHGKEQKSHTFLLLNKIFFPSPSQKRGWWAGGARLKKTIKVIIISSRTCTTCGSRRGVNWEGTPPSCSIDYKEFYYSSKVKRREGEKEKKEEKRKKKGLLLLRVYDRSFSCAGVDSASVKVCLLSSSSHHHRFILPSFLLQILNLISCALNRKRT